MWEKAKLSATTNIAPAFIPSTPASAKGFRVTPCITAPATAKAAYNSCTITLGSLNS